MNDELRRLNEDLRVHQEELENQNRELREIQAQLEASRDRYADLYDFAPVGYVNFDGRGRVRDINLTGAALLGVVRSRLVGMTFHSLVDAGDRPAFLRHIHRCKSGTGKTATGIRLAPATGKPIDVELQSVPFRGDGGETLYRTAIIDVTERKRAEEMLRSSEELFHQLFEQNEEPLFLFRSGTCDVVDVNPAAERLYGHSRENLLRDGIRLFVPEEERQGFALAIASIRPGSALSLALAEHLRREGGRVTVSIRGMSVRLAGGHVSYLSIRDITARVRMEEEAKIQHAQLIQANRMAALGTIVSGVAHEVNNPNNLIMFNAPMVLSAWEDVRPVLEAHFRERGDFPLLGFTYSEMREVVPRLAAGISDASARIKAIVANLKDFARQDKSRRHVPLQVNELVRAAVHILYHEIIKATHRFEMQFAEGLPPVTGSAQELQQVVVNLLNNALQALPSGGCGLKVTTRRNPDTGDVEVEVADEGTGMSPEVLSRITEPFFSTHLDSGGLGLGLSISRTILKEHGGSLSFESEVGKGTRAFVRLPAAKSAGE